MKILHLTIKKKWFDMIASGEKKEEYREVKAYWVSRLTSAFSWSMSEYPIKLNENKQVLNRGSLLPKNYTHICFKNGYAKDSPSVTIELKGITIGLGMLSWGAEPDIEYFILQLGEIINQCQ